MNLKLCEKCPFFHDDGEALFCGGTLEDSIRYDQIIKVKSKKNNKLYKSFKIPEDCPFLLEQTLST